MGKCLIATRCSDFLAITLIGIIAKMKAYKGNKEVNTHSVFCEQKI